MKFREAIFEYIKEKKQEIEILKSELSLKNFEMEVLEAAFNQDVKSLNDEEKNEMIELIKEILINDKSAHKAKE